MRRVQKLVATWEKTDPLLVLAGASRSPTRAVGQPENHVVRQRLGVLVDLGLALHFDFPVRVASALGAGFSITNLREVVSHPEKRIRYLPLHSNVVTVG